MGRGPRPTKGKAKPAVPRKSPTDDAARVRDLEKRLAEASKREAEALARETATGEILRVISRSPTDVQPVFDALAENAARLCQSLDADIRRRDGDLLRLVAHHGSIPVSEFTLPIIGTVAGRAVLEGRTVQVADVQAESAEFRASSAHARRTGFRTVLSIPLMRGGAAIGTINVRRTEARPFSERQVALLQTFADQAVIAIENARLFAETTEALERQMATAEILRVVSRSTTDVQPVFDVIVQNACRLCDGVFANAVQFDGALIHNMADYGFSPEAREMLLRAFPTGLTRESMSGRAILARAVVQSEDMSAEPATTISYQLSRLVGSRAYVSVPLLREGVPIGAITVARPEPGLFPERQVELLQTFADQAVIAIEDVRLFKELEARNRDLTTALDRQMATSEILRVISSSPTDIQPVFDAIVRSAVRLCDGLHGVLDRFDGELIHFAAQYNYTPEALQMTLRMYPRQPDRKQAAGRAILTGNVVNIADVQADPEYATDLAVAGGWRSVLNVPMLREGKPIGTIGVIRGQAGCFSDAQVELLRTFADQAIIAIENVRLFTELQEKNKALTQAHAQVTQTLEQQTASADILKVISRSPTDVQPVFDAIAQSAMRLCGADIGGVYQFDGELFDLVAHHNFTPESLEALRRKLPRPARRDTVSGRAILQRAVVQIEDVLADPEYDRDVSLASGWRSMLAAPMLREDTPIGTIVINRIEPGPFTANHIELLKTFAAQAVIAIENVRLFTELQTSNRELTTALDTQTATSDILRVISRSQTDVQPVFDTIVASAVRLLKGYSVALTRITGDQIELVALTSADDAGNAALRALFPRSLQSKFLHAQAIRDRAPLNIADAQTDPRSSEAGHASAGVTGRSLAVVPLLRHDEAVGTISVTRRERGGFTEDEIALLQTFADQAVIAIENVRLLTELQARTQELTRSVGQLTALGEVGRAVSSTLDLETVLNTIVSRAIQLSGTDGGSVYEYNEGAEEFSLRASRNLPEAYVEQVRDARPRKGEGAVGRVAQMREPVQIADISDAAAYDSRVRNMLLQIGLRALLAVPLIAEDQLVGALIVMRKRPGTFGAEEVALLQTFATQSALAIQNARLFREIEDKSRQLEVASQHKSEFLANMSHELRTPLNAIIGFSEVLTDRMFGELNEKQEEYLKDIYASGTHLLSLINDILDLSKIEAGRMELELSEFDLPTALENALMLIRERAGRRSIALHTDIDGLLGQVQADERKVRQVVLNLLSNAIKFTPEGGRIDVSAVPKDGFVEVSVSDTGIGIAPEDQEKVFEEFRQVGTAAKKIEGTGLGLTLCRKFVELHGGKIWVKSQLGQGSTFTFTIPVRHGE